MPASLFDKSGHSGTVKGADLSFSLVILTVIWPWVWGWFGAQLVYLTVNLVSVESSIVNLQWTWCSFDCAQFLKCPHLEPFSMPFVICHCLQRDVLEIIIFWNFSFSFFRTQKWKKNIAEFPLEARFLLEFWTEINGREIYSWNLKNVVLWKHLHQFYQIVPLVI